MRSTVTGIAGAQNTGFLFVYLFHFVVGMGVVVIREVLQKMDEQQVLVLLILLCHLVLNLHRV